MRQNGEHRRRLTAPAASQYQVILTDSNNKEVHDNQHSTAATHTTVHQCCPSAAPGPTPEVHTPNTRMQPAVTGSLTPLPTTAALLRGIIPYAQHPNTQTPKPAIQGPHLKRSARSCPLAASSSRTASRPRLCSVSTLSRKQASAALAARPRTPSVLQAAGRQVQGG